MDPSQIAATIMNYYSEHDDLMSITSDMRDQPDNEIIIQILLAVYQEMVFLWKTMYSELTLDRFQWIYAMGIASLGFGVTILDFDDIIESESLVYYVRIDETLVLPEMKINTNHPLCVASTNGTKEAILYDINELSTINILKNNTNGKIDVITFYPL